jgi:3-oxoacyl-[acyl-carrier-protein] synthase II
MESDLSASDIRHINAHATSTPQGDVAEILACTEPWETPRTTSS